MKSSIRARLSHPAALAAITLSLVLATAIAVMADTRIYVQTAAGYTTYTSFKTEANSAILCNSNGCAPNVTCTGCHASTTSDKPMTTSVQNAHFDRYYAKGEILLAEGASLRFGRMMLRRMRGELHMIDPASGKMQLLAPGARILKGKDGQPWIHYPGAAAPPFSR